MGEGRGGRGESKEGGVKVDGKGGMRWGECHTQSHTHTHTLTYISLSAHLLLMLALARSHQRPPPPLFSPSFFQVIPSVTSVLLISPCFFSYPLFLSPLPRHHT